MVWLIHQLIRWSVIGVRVLVIGPTSFQPMRRRPVTEEVAIPHGNRPPYQQFTYGPMMIRVWRNWDTRGELYLNLDIVRQVGRGRTAKSFRPDDLDDVERCIHKIRAWLRDSN